MLLKSMQLWRFVCMYFVCYVNTILFISFSDVFGRLSDTPYYCFDMYCQKP